MSEAWQVTKGDVNVRVGVIDSGFDFFHPALKGRLIPGFYHTGGYHTECFENIAHGTSVAGLIVAREGPDNGPAGLAPDCRVVTASLGLIDHALAKMHNRFFQDHPTASAADLQAELAKHQDALRKAGQEWARYQASGVAAGVRYLVDHGVKVINISGYLQRRLCPSTEVWDDLEGAFSYAAGRNVVIVLGAGNSAARSEEYPGSPETVIVVGATRLDETRWEEEATSRGMTIKQGSNFGSRLTLMAPVENLRICVPHDPRVYATLDGPMGTTKVDFQGPYQVVPIGATSCAAPIVTALVALMHAVRPDLDARSVVAIVKQGCDALGGEGHDLYTGYGQVNFGKTIRRALEWIVS